MKTEKKLLDILLILVIGSIIIGSLIWPIYILSVDKQKRSYVLSDNEVIYLTLDYNVYNDYTDDQARYMLDSDIIYLNTIFYVNISSTEYDQRRARMFLDDAKIILYSEDEIYIFNETGIRYIKFLVDNPTVSFEIVSR